MREVAFWNEGDLIAHFDENEHHVEGVIGTRVLVWHRRFGIDEEDASALSVGRCQRTSGRRFVGDCVAPATWKGLPFGAVEHAGIAHRTAARLCRYGQNGPRTDHGFLAVLVEVHGQLGGGDLQGGESRVERAKVYEILACDGERSAT